MTVQITSSFRSEYGFHMEATCDKISAAVSVNKDGSLQVVCQNAAHKVWRGFGKNFNSLEEALTAYKSGQMKAIIQTAAEGSIQVLEPVVA